MIRFFFFPLWKVEKVEKELSRLEQDGWRLDKVSFVNCFQFVESSPKKTSYFFTYKLIKENGMADIEHFLKSKLGANPINGAPAAILHSVYVYRIASDANLEKLWFYRNIYLQHLVGQQILSGMFLPIISVVTLIIQLITFGIGTADMPFWIFIGLMNVIPLLYCVYQFMGLRQLKKQYKKMLPHISISYDDFRS